MVLITGLMTFYAGDFSDKVISSPFSVSFAYFCIQYFDIVSKIVEIVRYRERRRKSDNAVHRKRVLGILLLDRGIAPLKYALLSAIFSDNCANRFYYCINAYFKSNSYFHENLGHMWCLT